MKTKEEKGKHVEKIEKQSHVTEQKPKSKFALYWESREGMEPGFEIVDMRAVLR